jgi:hypothetical protein
MWQTALLTFLAGILGGNAIPHFVKGITRERYPTVFGSAPIVNLVVGWTGLVVAALLLHVAEVDTHAIAAAIAGPLGVLVMGIFHAGPGAFGRNP